MITEKQIANILDLVMTTTDLSINGLEVTDKIGDHQMIAFSLEVQDPNTRTQHKQVLDYKRANFELIKEELGSYNYEVSLIYVKEKLQPQIKTKRATEKSEIHLNIQPHPGQTIKIVLVYTNPTCTAIEDDEFYDCLDIILSTPHETLIMGDFNLPHIN
ncbi:Endonuclease/exonuclease/phosphatase [Trinorchestia longiramus]|nr:Endonuclease/exonuclease/phosphatase [Trinorchestia longiramus]